MSVFTVAFIYSLFQLSLLALYLTRRDLSVLVVEPDARKTLLYRSLVSLVGTLLFFQSMRHLLPVVSILAMHTGLVMLTCIFRIIAFQDLFISFTISKIKGVILLIEFGAVPGLAVVDMDQFNDKFRMTEYWAYLIVAIVSGFMLATATKMTHTICRNSGLLRHESQMVFYQHLIACLVLPVIIAAEYLGRDRYE